MTIKMSEEEVRNKIKRKGIRIISEKTGGSGNYKVLNLSNNSIVNVWDNGTVNCQGKNQNETREILESMDTELIKQDVFVVYGHDSAAKAHLEAMLRRWGLEPIMLDQKISSGKTLIEKLETYTEQVGFGIVLATPDDEGYPKGKPEMKQYRARQNVVLELGMLISKIGRKRVAILLSKAEKMEKPSDIEGLIYFPFKENPEEVGRDLAKEMKQCGFNIELERL